MRKLISGLAMAALVAPAAVSAQTQMMHEQPRTLSINATATVERAPDQAVLMLAVESEGQSARSAASANATKMDKVMAALRQLNIPASQIRTVSYELQPQYAQERNAEPRIASYRAVNQVQVVLDPIERVGPTIDAALGAGANRVSSLVFGLKDTQGARLEALTKAVEKAKREAEAIARAAGETLGPAMNISADGYFAPPPRPVAMYSRAAMDMAPPAAPTPVEAGTLEIGATVSIVFRLVP